MIAFLRGEVAFTGSGYTVLDVHGVGYHVQMPDGALTSLVQGDSVQVFTHLQVREDGMSLYGFLSAVERDWFGLLIRVTGVGPKGALQILSHTQFETFVSAVLAQDSEALCRLPGIGKKTAQRLILELRDKVTQIHSVGTPLQTASEGGRLSVGREQSTLTWQIVEALVSLGYNESQATDVVRRVETDKGLDNLEAGLRACLQQLAKPVYLT
ncbi:Holliday junction branch migration protein RuvA [Alicyclobacillaceae bacterium I2511]|nr:Holliday junction branch migration protein RuvA [Alicyclobacillaceae bacterium I2511]